MEIRRVTNLTIMTPLNGFAIEFGTQLQFHTDIHLNRFLVEAKEQTKLNLFLANKKSLQYRQILGKKILIKSSILIKEIVSQFCRGYYE